MPNLLVTGASGFLGWNLCQLAAADWQVYGIGRSRTIAHPYVTAIQADLTDFSQLRALFQQIQPDAVMHLAAQSAANICQQQPEQAYAINVTAAGNMAGLCADFQVPCVFTSTDLVFDGRNPPYRETDPVSPINHYGEQKALAEQLMLERYPLTAICRMPLLFGAAPPTASSFLQPFLQTLRAEQELKLFVDEFRTPVSGTIAVQGLLLALQQDVQGILHLGGKDRLSRYEFGQLMVEILELPTTGLRACRQQDVNLAAPRPADVSLDSSKAFGLGYAPPSLRSQLATLKGLV
ncbi:SDR family oxidoreductase [Pantanalinema sp. GBBB05]|uniref:SDR family oxidoreductase n=1 Tax=Pantanalinema sp. GBBB05 TaxID=2604139 RepID=UPI001DF141E4|nr:NAD(P)-dependent oxidoreductase [Pantanalinema sp. GBBB05]